MDKPSVIWSGGEYRTKCVVGLERDGVINELVDYVARPEDFKPIAGSMDAIAEMRRKGYKISIITDQRGIEQGHYKQEDVELVNDEMFKHLGGVGVAEIDGLYYSAGAQKQDPYVKPNIEMFKRCEKERGDIRFKGGYYVGHTMRDLKAAVAIGARPVLVRTGQGAKTEQDLSRYAYRDIKPKVMIFDNLAAFVELLN
jgi:D-glycero-D-manno-heptose 1,7-bisphosphate phosphatase